MPVNFLELNPRPLTGTLTIETDGGPVEIELSGIPLDKLSDVAKRYPAFVRLISSGSPGTILEAAEAMPSVVAASLGHVNSPIYEEKIRQFPSATIIQMAMTALALTFPQAAVNPLLAAAGADPAAASPTQSSNWSDGATDQMTSGK